MRLLLTICLLTYARVSGAQDCMLINAHAHNDYRQEHPLSDALGNKFASVEADIFLIGGELIVSHLRPISKKKTLGELYLKPLLDSCHKNKGRVYPDCEASFILLVDIKSNAEETYSQLKKELLPYTSMLSRYENGQIHKNAVTIILSGNKPDDAVKRDSARYVFIDQSLLGLEKTSGEDPAFLMASTKYSNVLNWKGEGILPANEKEKLSILVQLAHKQGKKVRLWASPENKTVWNELLNCGVDLINTDDLEELSSFLRERE